MLPIRAVTFIGIGNMGTPMAARLCKAGFELTVFDARPQAAQVFVAQHGGRVAASLDDAGSSADAVITMLPDDKAVRSVLLGPSGLSSSLRASSLVIDMSTSDPRGTVETGRELSRRAIEFIDAPVMGGVAFAQDGTLDILAGGGQDLVALCRPIFDAVGRQVFHCGPLGSGHAMKVLANYVNACALISLAEAMTVGRKAGLERDVMTQALLSMCCGRQHPLEKKIIPHVLTRKFATGMALGLIAKDVKIASELAHSVGVQAPLADRVREIWSNGALEIGASADQTEIVRLWEEQTDVRL